MPRRHGISQRRLRQTIPTAKAFGVAILMLSPGAVWVGAAAQSGAMRSTADR